MNGRQDEKQKQPAFCPRDMPISFDDTHVILGDVRLRFGPVLSHEMNRGGGPMLKKLIATMIDGSQLEVESSPIARLVIHCRRLDEHNHIADSQCPDGVYLLLMLRARTGGSLIFENYYRTMTGTAARTVRMAAKKPPQEMKAAEFAIAFACPPVIGKTIKPEKDRQLDAHQSLHYWEIDFYPDIIILE